MPVRTEWLGDRRLRHEVNECPGTAERTVVDPTLEWSTYFGKFTFPSGEVPEDAIHLGGSAQMTFPTTPGSYDPTGKRLDDAFVLRLDHAGTKVLFGTFVGGSYGESGLVSKVDSSGATYIAGDTGSPDFPISPQAPDPLGPDQSTDYLDGFACKLSADGTSLAYATYIGGSAANDAVRAGAIDASGRFYLTGYTNSTQFPVTPNAQFPSLSWGNAIVVVLNPSGSAFEYSSYLGGQNPGTDGFGLDLDSSGNLLVSGSTSDATFPATPGSFDPTFDHKIDVFVARLKAGTYQIDWATFMGGWGDQRPSNQTVDSHGRPVVVGETFNGNFPVTPGAFDPSWNGGIDTFFTRLSADGTSLLFSSFLGGASSDRWPGVALDQAECLLLTGFTFSNESFGFFPVTPDAFQSSFSIVPDAFVTKLDPTGSTLLYSTLLGGGDLDYGRRLVPFPHDGRVLSVGETWSQDFPVTPGVSVFDLCGGEFTNHGAGCAGSSGLVPHLSGFGCASPGRDITLRITDATAGSVALLLAGLGQGPVPLPGPCAHWIGPLVPGFVLPPPLASTTLLLEATLPATTPPGVIELQAVIPDPQAPFGIRATDALTMSIGY